MASESERSSNLSERHRSMVADRTTPLYRISRPGSAVDLILDRMGAMQADTRESMAVMQSHIGAVQANIIGVVHGMLT